ncbi:hypothetical protein ACQ4PT_058331 [Festuca glaucescens]
MGYHRNNDGGDGRRYFSGNNYQRRFNTGPFNERYANNRIPSASNSLNAIQQQLVKDTAEALARQLADSSGHNPGATAGLVLPNVSQPNMQGRKANDVLHRTVSVQRTEAPTQPPTVTNAEASLLAVAGITKQPQTQTFGQLGFVPAATYLLAAAARSPATGGAALLQQVERDPAAKKTSLREPIRRTLWPLPRPELPTGRSPASFADELFAVDLPSRRTPDTPCSATRRDPLQFKMETGKAVWDATAARIFCECAAKQVGLGNRPTKFLSATGYKNLVADFNVQTGRNYERKHMKNRWDDLKAIYSAWVFYKNQGNWTRMG